MRPLESGSCPSPTPRSAVTGAATRVLAPAGVLALLLGLGLLGAAWPVQATDGAAAEEKRRWVEQARALAAQGRHRAALDPLDRALQLDPGDRALRIERAQVNAWRGRHRVSARALQDVLRDHPFDREATHRLAEVWQWMDRPDRALALLDAHTARDPADPHAAGLRRDLQRAQRAEGAVDFRRFTQSDALDIADLRARFDVAPRPDGTRAGVQAATVRFRPSNPSTGDVTLRRLGLQAQRPLGDDFSAWGTVGLERLQGTALARPLQRWTHDLRLTFQPTDPWRLTLGSARWTFDSIEALRTGLTARETRLELETRPDDVHRGTLQLASAGYSDGNARRSIRLDLQRRLHRWPHVAVGLKHQDDDYRRPGQPGYFNPDRLRSTHLTVDLGGDFGAVFGDAGRRLQWQAGGSAGIEREPGRDRRPVRSGRLQLTGLLKPDLAVELAVDHSTSRVVDRDGFARSIVRLSLRQRF